MYQTVTFIAAKAGVTLVRWCALWECLHNDLYQGVLGGVESLERGVGVLKESWGHEDQVTEGQPDGIMGD